jgi:hypothetical protein
VNTNLGNTVGLHLVLFDGGLAVRDGADGGLVLGRQGGEALWKQVSSISTRIAVIGSSTAVSSLSLLALGRFALCGLVKLPEFYLALPGKGGDHLAFSLCLFSFCLGSLVLDVKLIPYAMPKWISVGFCLVPKSIPLKLRARPLVCYPVTSRRMCKPSRISVRGHGVTTLSTLALVSS